jgi:hypothetical protein
MGVEMSDNTKALATLLAIDLPDAATGGHSA